jgi:protein SCO1
MQDAVLRENPMKSIVFVTLLVLSLSAVVTAQQPAAPANTGTPKDGPAAVEKSGAEKSVAEKYFTDIELVNQNGEKMRFYHDLLQGKTVIINSFFATCQGSCLPITRNLEKIQEALGDRLGKDARIISISVDPTVDTPGELMAFGKKFNARPGWYFLTGSKENVEFVLKKLGQFVENKQDHYNIIILGNDRTGLWKKAFGLAKSEELIKVVDTVLNDKAAQD